MGAYENATVFFRRYQRARVKRRPTLGRPCPGQKQDELLLHLFDDCLPIGATRRADKRAFRRFVKIHPNPGIAERNQMRAAAIHMQAIGMQVIAGAFRNLVGPRARLNGHKIIVRRAGPRNTQQRKQEEDTMSDSPTSPS